MSDVVLKAAPVNDRCAVVALDVAPTGADLVVDTLGYGYVAVQIVAASSGTVAFQVGNDGTNYVSATLVASDDTSAALVASTTAEKLYSGRLAGRFLRLHITGVTTTHLTGEVYLTR
jgi:hypothetical protein